MSTDKIIIMVVVLLGVSYFFYNSHVNKQLAKKNAAQGEAFLAENQSQEGVKTTYSGLQYLVLEQANEETNRIQPTATDKVLVHYHGTLISGEVFDSSVERGEPISFGLNQVISGWTEGLQLMSEGDKYRFFIPAHLAYGNRAVGKIEPQSTLIFDVELLKVNP